MRRYIISIFELHNQNLQSFKLLQDILDITFFVQNVNKTRQCLMSNSQNVDLEEGPKNINSHKNIQASRPLFLREMTARLERTIIT